MTNAFQLDYENDWSGECRNDPFDGNAYVLREIHLQRPSGAGVPQLAEDYSVKVNDIFGGHVRLVSLDEWLRWEKSPNA